MINQIKKLYNRLFHPLPKLDHGVYPISIKFYPTDTIIRTGFVLQWCLVDNNKQWPVVCELVGYVDNIGQWVDHSYFKRNIVDNALYEYILKEFNKAEMKGELK